jgi:hypothetical protein
MKTSLLTENSLVIRIAENSISYSIFDDDENLLLNQIINVHSSKMEETQFLEQFFNEKELQVVIEDITIVFENEKYQLIPNDIYRKEHEKVLFELEFGEDDNAVLEHNVIPIWGVHVVYRVNRTIKRFFEVKYPNVEIKHHIFKLLKDRIKKNQDKVYVNIRKNSIDVIVVNENGLQLVNTFEVKTDEDKVFFIMNVYEQLGLNAEEFPLLLLTKDTKSNELSKLLEGYIEHIEID